MIHLMRRGTIENPDCLDVLLHHGEFDKNLGAVCPVNSEKLMATGNYLFTTDDNIANRLVSIDGCHLVRNPGLITPYCVDENLIRQFSEEFSLKIHDNPRQASISIIRDLTKCQNVQHEFFAMFEVRPRPVEQMVDKVSAAEYLNFYSVGSRDGLAWDFTVSPMYVAQVGIVYVAAGCLFDDNLFEKLKFIPSQKYWTMESL